MNTCERVDQDGGIDGWTETASVGAFGPSWSVCQRVCVCVYGWSQDLCEWAAKQTQSRALIGGLDELKSEWEQQKLE